MWPRPASAHRTAAVTSLILRDTKSDQNFYATITPFNNHSVNIFFTLILLWTLHARARCTVELVDSLPMHCKTPIKVIHILSKSCIQRKRQVIRPTPAQLCWLQPSVHRLPCRGRVLICPAQLCPARCHYHHRPLRHTSPLQHRPAFICSNQAPTTPSSTQAYICKYANLEWAEHTQPAQGTLDTGHQCGHCRWTQILRDWTVIVCGESCHQHNWGYKQGRADNVLTRCCLSVCGK